MQVVDLSGKWQLEGQPLDQPVSASVPGCVHMDLLRAKVIEDPYYRDRENDVQWIGRTDWVYRRTFRVTKQMLEHDQLLLECDGLDTLAELRVNGRRAGTADNMFRIWNFDVKRLLVAGENTIEVRFESPLPYIESRQKKRPLPAWWHRGAAYLRKEYCNFGWDWAPVLITCGIWREMRLVGWSGARLGDVRIDQSHTRGKVALDVMVEVEKAGAEAVTADVTVFLGKQQTAKAEGVRLRANRGKAALTVKDPQLWWPVGLGDQPLYTVTVELRGEDGAVLDKWERRIGLRTLELVRRKDQWGETFEFACNGVSFFAKGANWIPADNFVPRVTEADYRRLIEDSVSANMNMLRVWGGGHYENDAFYDLCDELGVCVWQDFMFACSTYPAFDDAFLTNVEQEARDNVRRLRHHACIALWCGNNELEQGLVDDEWTDRAMSWEDYGKLFDTLLPRVCKELAPQTVYWPGSPHTPHGDRRDWNDTSCGDAHLWSVWHGREPFEWYNGCRHRFVSEFGFQSFPHPRTVEGYTLPGDRNVTSPVMEHHQRSGTGNTLIMTYMLDWFRMPRDFESTLWLSQILQGMAIRFLVEQLRRNSPRSMGAIYWQLNDCWPVASWASIDGEGRWKALHYMARRIFAPRLVSSVPDPATGDVEVHVTGDPGKGGPGTVSWYLTTAGGRTVEKGSQEVRIPDGASKRVAKLRLGKSLEKHGARDLILWLELKVSGKIVSTNKALFCRPKQMDLAPTSSISVSTKAMRDGRHRVTLKSSQPILWAWIDHKSADLKCSDNFVPLRPGKSLTIDVRPSKKLTAAAFKSGLKLMSLRDTY